MWHRDRKEAHAIEKNGADRLAWCRVAKNIQFFKKGKKENSVCEVQYSETIKFGMPILWSETH